MSVHMSLNSKETYYHYFDPMIFVVFSGIRTLAYLHPPVLDVMIWYESGFQFQN